MQKLQLSSNELGKSNLSKIPTSSFNCFIEKSEFPIYPQLLQILQLLHDYFHFGNSQLFGKAEQLQQKGKQIMVVSKMEITTLMEFTSYREKLGN